MVELTHFNAQGEAHMVAVGDKKITHRVAVATGSIRMQKQTLEHIISGAHKKGDVLGVARIAAIMAAKKTAELIPLCHTLQLNHIAIQFSPVPEEQQIVCRCEGSSTGTTGIEMEILLAVQIALLTIYDMCKAVDRGMRITDIQLVHKSGGKSGEWNRATEKEDL